jgi:hypothetical protein
MNEARTTGTPGWLSVARRAGTVGIRLEAEPALLRRGASMMMLASDSWHEDFAIVQAHAALSVWVLRPGADPEGWPPFTVRGGSGRTGGPTWRCCCSTAVSASRSTAGRGWPGTFPPAPCRRGARGRSRSATQCTGAGRGRVRSGSPRCAPGNYAVNYVRPGTLSIPRGYWYLPDHIELFPPTQTGQWLLALVDLLTSIPAGFLSAGPGGRLCTPLWRPCSRRCWPSRWRPGSFFSRPAHIAGQRAGPGDRRAAWGPGGLAAGPQRARPRVAAQPEPPDAGGGAARAGPEENRGLTRCTRRLLCDVEDGGGRHGDRAGGEWT